MARRHHEGEGGGGGGGARRRIHLVVLLLICVTCGGVYLVCSPVLRNPFEKEVSSLSETKKKTMVVGSLDDKESCCHGAEGTELWGEAVNWGPHLILNSSYQCCTACKANSKCNSWVFCGDRDKCAAKYGEVRKFSSSSSSSSSSFLFLGISEVLLLLRLLLPFFVFLVSLKSSFFFVFFFSFQAATAILRMDSSEPAGHHRNHGPINIINA
jgi:hypothetical protein